MATRPRIIAIAAAAALVIAGGVAGAVAIATNGGLSGGSQTVTFRVWDEKAAASYERSFTAFEAANPDIHVEINVVPYADYFGKLRTDIAGEGVDDIFWTNSSNFATYAKQGELQNISTELGADTVAGFEKSVVKQYSVGGTLWGVPQLSEPGSALLYNAALLKAAGLSPADLQNLRWDPTGANDTLLPLLKKLTVDSKGRTADSPDFDASSVSQYGYNAANELNSIYLNYLGSNGATLQKGEHFTFNSAKGVQSIQYLVDLINKQHVSPPAADTNGNGEFARDEFLKGKIALLQTGVDSLAKVRDSAKFPWGVAPMPAGPKGAISSTNGIAAAASASTEHPDAVKRVLQWISSRQGARYLGSSGKGTPAVTEARTGYVEYWKKKGVDVTPFFTVLKNGTVQGPRGTKFSDAADAFTPIFDDIFEGKVSVADGLARAENAANAAIK
ncbi:sugar ABC transporter substrate-binding protein [Agreia sp. COWG]|uniref:ABC transporter substrate-binding protein n=1 Tax=Agreia sp. COWG TaxID=2773266 RepID=UPI001925798B|nr:sugar ABC transporter substrate-binding protein [Agreia sp. COWG]CAD5991160.1 Sugar ABC transporter substrate-binding protein [Agreia sp. COWG]